MSLHLGFPINDSTKVLVRLVLHVTLFLNLLKRIVKMKLNELG